MTYTLGWAAAGRAGIIHTLTGTTNTTGALTLALPANLFTAVLGVMATAIRDTVNPATGCFALVRSYSTTQVVIQVFEGRNVGLGSEALEVTPTATPVNVTVIGY